jgi:hypothetical protein
MQTIKCPQCPAENLPAYADRHAAIHARELRNHDERVAMDKALTAAYGPARRA